jgi:hypothetical protein
VNSDLAGFGERCQGIRFVYDIRNDQITAVAIQDPTTGHWDTVLIEGKVEQIFRHALIDVLANATHEMTRGMLASATGVNEIVAVAKQAMAPRRTIMLALCNAATQAVAHWLGLGLAAEVLGDLVETTLASALPEDRHANAIKTVSILDVTYDVASGRLTPAMQEFTLDQLANVIKHETAGITRAQLGRLADELPMQPYVTLEDLEPSDQGKLSDDWTFGSAVDVDKPFDEPPEPGRRGGL